MTVLDILSEEIESAANIVLKRDYELDDYIRQEKKLLPVSFEEYSKAFKDEKVRDVCSYLLHSTIERLLKYE